MASAQPAADPTVNTPGPSGSDHTPLVHAGATPDASSSPPTPHEQHQLGRRRRVSAMSRLLGHMTHNESNPQPTWVIGVITLETNPGITELRRHLLAKFMKIPRFRSKLAVNRWGGHWEEAEVDAGYHFEVACYGTRASQDDIDAVVAAQNSWPFDAKRPLWKLIHIPEGVDGTSVIIPVINHALGDGVALVNVLMNLCDGLPEVKKSAAHKGKRAAGPKLPMHKVIGMQFYGAYQSMTITMWRPDSKNALKLVNRATPQKLVAASPSTISLVKVKEIAKRMGNGVTVNDVLMANFVRTLKAFYVEVGDLLVAHGERKVRSQFPMNIRKRHEGPADEEGSPNNRFGFGMITLPLDFKDSADLIVRIKQKIDLVKISPAPMMTVKSLPMYMATLPRPVLLNVLLDSVNLGTCQLSNVPGPQSQVTMAGVVVCRFSFFLFSTLGCYFGVASYNGEISASVNLDASIGADPKQVVKHWSPEFELMYKEIMALKSGPVG